jgi:hypothetical protein
MVRLDTRVRLESRSAVTGGGLGLLSCHELDVLGLTEMAIGRLGGD